LTLLSTSLFICFFSAPSKPLRTISRFEGNRNPKPPPLFPFFYTPPLPFSSTPDAERCNVLNRWPGAFETGEWWVFFFFPSPPRSCVGCCHQRLVSSPAPFSLRYASPWSEFETLTTYGFCFPTIRVSLVSPSTSALKYSLFASEGYARVENSLSHAPFFLLSSQDRSPMSAGLVSPLVPGFSIDHF